MHMYLFSVEPGARKGELDYIPHPPVNTATGEPFHPDGEKLLTIEQIAALDQAVDSERLRALWTRWIKQFVPADDTPESYYGRLAALHARNKAVKAAEIAPPPKLDPRASDAEFELWYIRNRICPHLSEAEADEFIRLCRKAEVSPLRGEVFPCFRADEESGCEKVVLGVTIAFMRGRVLASGTFNGYGATEWCGPDSVWRDVWTEDRPPHAARVFMHRKGVDTPIMGVAYYRGAARMVNYGGTRQPSLSEAWTNNSPMQLSKCAAADAFRKGWHDILGDFISQEELLAAPPPQAAAASEAAGPAGVGAPSQDDADPASQTQDDADAPASRQSFELALMDLGVRDAARRGEIVTRLKQLLADVFREDEATAWQTAWQRVKRNPRAFGIAVPIMRLAAG